MIFRFYDFFLSTDNFTNPLRQEPRHRRRHLHDPRLQDAPRRGDAEPAGERGAQVQGRAPHRRHPGAQAALQGQLRRLDGRLPLRRHRRHHHAVLHEGRLHEGGRQPGPRLVQPQVQLPGSV